MLQGEAGKPGPRSPAENLAFAENVILRASAPGGSSSRNLLGYSEILRYLAARD